MPIYPYGSTPDSYVEDRDSGDRMPSVSLTILDGVTLDPVTGLLDGDGVPTAGVVTDAYGYWRFSCESASVVIEATDSLGTTRWGPIASPGAIRDTAITIPSLTTDVAGLTTDVASLTTDVAAAAAAAQSVADALADLPPATGDVVTVRHDPDADAWYDAEGAEVTVRPSTPAWPRANVVWDSSLSPLVTSPPALAVRGDAWLPHGSVDPTA